VGGWKGNFFSDFFFWSFLNWECLWPLFIAGPLVSWRNMWAVFNRVLLVSFESRLVVQMSSLFPGLYLTTIKVESTCDGFDR
jgi:hypothetical protein